VHVAVDARFAVLDDRGIGRYTRALMAQLLDADGVTFSFVVPGLFGPRNRIAQTLGADRRSVSRRVPAGATVVWSPSNGTDLTTALPCVTTVHDVVPFTFPSASARIREREQAPFLRTAARAARVLASSHFMASEMSAQLAIPRERITVAPLGVAAPFIRRGDRYTLPDGRPYVLHVGAHDERKNVGTLVAAWQKAFAPSEVALVFTRAPKTLPDGAVVADAASDADLARIYRGAAVVAVPSIDEGFGLPLLEGLACGAPVIASRAAALPEVGGDAVAWIHDPRNVDVWTAGLLALVHDPDAARELAARGPAQAAMFTWERCAQITLGALRETALPG
jgi:glycosyltransferase involved in cell wall biosynthesis